MIARDGEQASVWAYCWRLSPGGRASLPNEYRIQMTTVESPLPLNPSGYTVLLGYDADMGVFAGFDVARHSTFTSGSPSIQVNRNVVTDALQSGLSFQTKSNGEIVVGIRRDLLLFYIERSTELHGLGEDSGYLDIVVRTAASRDVPSSDIDELSEARQRVVRETSQWSRSARFRKEVLIAYENRCAVTRRQLNLVDAAHILPVSAGSESIDSVRNGVALSPTYHRAFDNGLIFLDDNMVMRLNRDAVSELRQLDIAGGLDGFASHLGPIHLPLTAELRPDPNFIRLANSYRCLGG